MPNHDLLNRDLAFLNEYQASIGIKLLLLYLLCYTATDQFAQRKQFFCKFLRCFESIEHLEMRSCNLW